MRSTATSIKYGTEALAACLELAPSTVLDIGSGEGCHARAFREAGFQVTTVDLSPPADYVSDYMQLMLPTYDMIWCCHVLEHQPNPNLFLSKAYCNLSDYGVLAITVPPLKHEIVGGHVSLWNSGLLLYHLILAGFDCREAKVKTYGYNISVLVRKKRAVLPELRSDYGDIAQLAEFFPFEVKEGFDGRVEEWNWQRSL